MTPTLIINHNRKALLRVLATLVAMIGLGPGGSIAILPRHLRLSALRLLRPVESAARRLVFAEACEMDVAARSERSGRSAPNKAKTDKRSKRQRKPSFPLIEALPRAGSPPPRHPKGLGPRMFFFDGTDPVIEVPPPPLSPDDPMDARGVCRRLLALQMVLNDLPKYARCLALWQARRAAAPPRSGRMHPLRRGRPPGFVVRGKREIDEILAECHQLALMVMEPPNTS